MDGRSSTAQSWFAVAGLQASRPHADKVASATYLRWPRVSVLELGAFPEAAPCARRHVRGALGEWGVPDGLIADMELICAELVTNAVQATTSLGERRLSGMRLHANWKRGVNEIWE